ncbi:MAG: pyridoxamine 5'-phosphate oxidase family protein [Anaerolineae bacterium]
MKHTQRGDIAHVRRRDRHVDDERWIQTFLDVAPVGVLATVADGQPFINSNLFVYDSERDCIYLHTAKSGRTRTNADQDSARACFSVMEMGRLLPDERALEFSVEYAGVVVFGVVDVVEDADETTHALQAIMNKYAPHLQPEQDYESATAEDLKRTSVFKLTIESWSGKKKEVADDFPGAYWYPETPILPSRQKR